MAAAISALTGTGQDETARGVSVFKAMLFLALIEALVWLSIPAMSLLGSTTTPRQPGPVIEAPVAMTVTTEAEALRWLIDRILASPGRRLTATGRELALLAGVAPSTFAARRKRWAADGKIIAVRSGNKTEFGLPRLRKVA